MQCPSPGSTVCNVLIINYRIPSLSSAPSDVIRVILDLVIFVRVLLLGTVGIRTRRSSAGVGGSQAPLWPR